MNSAEQKAGRARPAGKPVFGAYDIFVRSARVALLLIGLGFAAFVILWPTLRDDEVAFTLSYEDAVRTDDQIRMVNPQYVGTDALDRQFRISASSGIQTSPDDPRIRLTGIVASIDLDEALVAEVVSDGGTYFVQANRLELDNGMELTTTDGYRFSTGAAQFDLARRVASSRQPLTGISPYGTVEAAGFEIQVDERLVIFEGRLHMRVFPGGFLSKDQ